MKPTVYVETSVIGYLTSWPSGDLIVAARQKITRDWWRDAPAKFDLIVSDVVLREAGTGDPQAVLDTRLRVRGVERLRVCDLSAMPNINAGNTNAPAMMLGSRCAELILQQS